VQLLLTGPDPPLLGSVAFHILHTGAAAHAHPQLFDVATRHDHHTKQALLKAYLTLIMRVTFKTTLRISNRQLELMATACMPF
jgi:hypothetical protein